MGQALEEPSTIQSFSFIIADKTNFKPEMTIFAIFSPRSKLFS
jgi:hypothetical protein